MTVLFAITLRQKQYCYKNPCCILHSLAIKERHKEYNMYLLWRGYKAAVDVSRGYKVHIKLNISIKQFLGQSAHNVHIDTT